MSITKYYNLLKIYEMTLVSFFISLVYISKFIVACRFPAGKSIADVTRSRYGQPTLDLFRTYERESIKLAKAECDLNFLQTCKDANLCPVFLRFKMSNHRLQKSSEKNRSDRRFLNKEINDKEKNCARLLERRETLKGRLQSSVG